MRLSFAFVVLAVAVVAVSARVYPAKTGGKGAGRTKGGSDGTAGHDDSFHMQSADGQYVFGHMTGNQARAEMRAEDGSVTGYYSYVGGNGQVVYVNYVADKNGYRVLSNAGVPSASVKIEGNVDKKESHGEKDFQKVFSDFTQRIKEKIVQQNGQQVVDPVDKGQQQIIVDPALHPTEETKPSKHEDKTPFPDWNQVKISTTQKPVDGNTHDEGQQQQEVVDPNWDSDKITTQKSNTKGNDYDGQGTKNDDWSRPITTTEPALRPIPLVPLEPQIPTKGGRSDVLIPEDRIKETTTTENTDSRIGTEATVIDDTENISPVTNPVSITDDVQTTISYDNGPGQITEGSIIGGGDSQTTISGTKSVVESSTTVISESTTDQVIKENKEYVPVTTEDPTLRTDFQTTVVVSNVDYTTIDTVNENVAITTSPVYEPKTITPQSEGKIGDVETTTAADIQYVTEENKDGFEFRTMESTDTIGTTISPDFEQPEVQEQQEIIWPEIPQEPIPQVLVPLNPYPDWSQTKNSGIKTQTTNLRPARHFRPDELKSTTTNVSETFTTTPMTYADDENTTLFNFPRYFLTG